MAASKVSINENICWGELVFDGTGIPVSCVGERLMAGEKVETIKEDFPSLSEEDIEFARLFSEWDAKGTPSLE